MIKSYFVLNSLSRQFCLNVTQPTELSIKANKMRQLQVSYDILLKVENTEDYEA